MYKLLLALILIFPLLSKAQITNNIDEVDKLNIYGNGNVKIGKIIIQSTRTRIFYAGYKQTIDSLGIYTTHYLFAPLEKLPTFGIDITIKFDKPLLPFGMDYFMVGPWGG